MNTAQAREIVQAVARVEGEFTDMLFSKVAPVLAGREVELHWVAPYISDMQGCTYRTGENKAVVCVRPGLAPDRRLEIFLHEMGHARLHLPYMGLSNNHTRTPDSRHLVNVDAYRRQMKTWDEQAETLACQWLGFAEDRAQGSHLFHKLYALLQWPG